jgi:hypothetical protein
MVILVIEKKEKNIIIKKEKKEINNKKIKQMKFFETSLDLFINYEKKVLF